MADWNLPGLTDTYTNVLTYLKNRLTDASLWLDSALTSPTNLPTGAKRWNSSTNKFEKWNGSAWVDLTTAYAISLSGTPTSPTAAAGTNTTQIATTEFVNSEIANDRPFEATASNIKMDGTQSVGTLGTVARGNHVHPTDTSLQPKDATLTALAGITTAADKLIYATGSDTFSTTTLTEFMRTLLDDATAATARSTLGVGDVAGQVAFFAMASAPAGWLKANGAAVSRTTYSVLFAAIGTTYGAGDGSTTFNLPDMRAEFPRGWDDARGVDAGRVFGSSQTDELKSHTHGLRVFNRAVDGTNEEGDDSIASSSPFSSGFVEQSGGSETRPRNIALLACIKY